MSRRFPKRKKYTHTSAEFIGIGLVVLLAAFFGFNPQRMQNFFIYIWVAVIALIVIIIVLVLFMRNRAQQKQRALQLIDLKHMSGFEFEKYLRFLLQSRGYKNVWITPSQGDFGADIIAEKEGKRYAIQAKRYHGMVGVDALYQCFGGQRYYGCDESMIITNSTFTPAAQELARKSHAELVDGETLSEWIVEMQGKKSSEKI